MGVVGEEVLIRTVEEGDGGSGDGDGGHLPFLLVRALVFAFFTFIGGVFLTDNESSRLLGEGDLGVTGVGGELGESFGEIFELVLSDEPSTIVFPSLKDTIRNKVVFVAAIVASSPPLLLPLQEEPL
jgi:hypothetical protein